MRLSEAIRLGAMLNHQEHWYLKNDLNGGTCAFGAVAEAFGVDPAAEEFVFAALRTKYPWLLNDARCPACHAIVGAWRRFRHEEVDVEDVVIHLNDDHRWSRERIAFWVETVELAPSVDAVDPHVADTGKPSTRDKVYS